MASVDGVPLPIETGAGVIVCISAAGSRRYVANSVGAPRLLAVPQSRRPSRLLSAVC